MNPDFEKALNDLARQLYEGTSGDVDFGTFYDELGRIMDVDSGAPLQVRTALASVRKPEDKLNVLRQYYPVASQDGKIMMYFDPDRGPVLVDEEGFSLKDLVDVMPFVGEVAGGVAGAVAGAMGGLGGTMAGSGAGAAVGREAVGRGMGFLAGAEDPRSGAQVVGEMAGDALLNAAGEGLGRGVAYGAGKAGAAVGSKYFGRQGAAEVGEAAARRGVPVSLGQTGASSTVQSMEQAARNMPGGMGVVDAMVEEQGKKLINLSDMIGMALRDGGPPQNAATANALIEQSLQGVVDRFNTTREALELAVERALPDGGDTLVPVSHVSEALSQLRAQYQGGDELMKQNAGDLIRWLEPLEAMAAQNEGLVPFRILRRTRTNINQALPPGDASGLAKGNLDTAAGILKQDLGEAARLGGRDAEKAWDSLNLFIRQARDEGNPISIQKLTKVMRSNSPRAALDFALQGSKEGGRRLAILRQQFSPDEWSVITSHVWDGLGKSAADGSWTGGTFLRNYAKLDATTKRVLWGDSPALPMIEDLVLLTGVRQGSQKFVNHSNTARTLLTSMLFGGGGAAAGGLKGFIAGSAIPMGASYAAAKAFTNPNFVRALTTGVRVLDRSPNTLPAVLGRIGATLQGDPDLMEWYSNAVSNLIR